MPEPNLKYAGNEFIKKDLKRLKQLISLEKDIKSKFKIINGLIDETKWPPTYDYLGGLITEFEIDGERILCFKDRIPISSPKLSPANGCRLIYALTVNSRSFIPLLVYRANEEGKDYAINNKKFSITSTNLGKIITEKLK